MPIPKPSSLELYEKILTSLHDQPAGMTLDALRTAARDHSSTIDNQVEWLTNQVDGYSPIMRTDLGSYALTPWARAMMDANPATIPPHPTDRTTDGTLDFQRQEQIIAAFVELLRNPPAGLLDQPSYAQMIQLLGATRHKLVADLAPASLQISLEIALEQVDRMTEGRVFFWPTPEGPPERVRVRGEQWFSYFGVRLDQRSHEHMLKMLANDLSGLIIPRSSVDQVTQIQAGSKRIVLGHLGEHITPQIVFTLHRECQDGETGHIYPIGRVTPEAIKEAARLNIQIHDLTKLKDHLGSAEIMNDDATVY